VQLYLKASKKWAFKYTNEADLIKVIIGKWAPEKQIRCLWNWVFTYKS